MRPPLRRLAAPLLSLVLAACQTAAPAPTAPAPADAAAAAPRARGPFVAAANPLAVEAGMGVLRRGGSAADAAVAIQAVLGLVEPQSSGLGGGAFLMHYDAETGAVTAYDGRETAPSAATPELFYEDGRPLPFVDAVLSGRSTGAPGRWPCWPWRRRITGGWPGATCSATPSAWPATASSSARDWPA